MAAHAGEIIAAAQQQEITLKPVLKVKGSSLLGKESKKHVRFVEETEVLLYSIQTESSLLPTLHPYFSHTDLPHVHFPKRDQINIPQASHPYSYKILKRLDDVWNKMVMKYKSEIKELNKSAFFQGVVWDLICEKAGTFEQENDLHERILFVVDEAMQKGIYWVKLANAIVYFHSDDILGVFKTYLQDNAQKIDEMSTQMALLATDEKQFLAGISYRIWQLMLDKDQWKLLSKIHEKDKISLFAKKYLDECFKEKNIKDKKKITSQPLQKPGVHFEEKTDCFLGDDKYLKDRLEQFISHTFETLSSKISDEDTEKKYLKSAIREITAQKARLLYIKDSTKSYNRIVRHVEKKIKCNAHLAKTAEIFVKENKLVILSEFRRKNHTYHLYGNQPYESGENSADKNPLFNEADLITGFTKWISKKLIEGKWNTLSQIDRNEGGLACINLYTNWYLTLKVRQYNFTRNQFDKYRKNILMVLLTPDITSFYRKPEILATDTPKFKMPGADENNQFEFNYVLYSWDNAWKNFACSEYGKYLLGEYGFKIEDRRLRERINSFEEKFDKELHGCIKQCVKLCLTDGLLSKEEMEIFYENMEEYLYKSMGQFWCTHPLYNKEESTTSLHAAGFFSEKEKRGNNRAENTSKTLTKIESDIESDSDKKYAVDGDLGTGDVVIRMQSF